MIDNLKKEFLKRFGEDGEIRVFASPGRVNLIGEHTDYNGGFVFPAAITLGTTIIARKRCDNIIRMQATDLPCDVFINLDDIENYKTLPWGNYQAGIASELMKEGYTLCGADLLFHDTTPHGGGLSSSAAIEVATALCLVSLAGYEADMKKMAVIGQRAENNYVGVNCGIMDQFASAMGKRDHVIFLDCKDLSYKLVPLNLKGKSIVITNTNKKRSLITSKYNERRAECEEGLNILQQKFSVNYLGEIPLSEYEKVRNIIENETIRKRIDHVIGECDRTVKSVEALKNNDIELFGHYMNLSHDSLRDLYEVTGIELDTLVDAARSVKGCIGSRMTGAGFGGCTVSIVEDDAVDTFKETVRQKYLDVIGYEPSFYITGAGDGGREIK